MDAIVTTVSTRQIMARRERLLGPNVSTFYDEPVHLVKGEGVWVWDAEGNKYLDCYNNVPHVGHCHPRVVDANCKQAATLNTHTRYLHEGILDYVERLTATFDDPLSTAIMTCTGSEANDIALRMAEAVTGKRGIIATDHTYHGNTTAVAQLSRTNIPKTGDGSHIRHVPAPDSYRPLGGEAGMAHARAFAAKNGKYCMEIDGINVDVLTWLDGETLASKSTTASLDEMRQYYSSIGQAMAELHEYSDQWILPQTFVRPNWDMDGLLGETPVWGRFWENPALSKTMRGKLTDARFAARERLSSIKSERDYGLIHADIIPDNVMAGENEIHLIDFDDGGFGYRLFDLATTLNKIPDTPQYHPCAQAFLDAYQSRRQIDLTHLPLFRALRAFSYVGWIITRLDHPGSEARLKNFIAVTEHHLTLLEEQAK